MRRNRLLVISAAAVFSALTTGVAGTSIGLLFAIRGRAAVEESRVEAERERDNAESERQNLKVALAENETKTNQLAYAKNETERRNSALLLQRGFAAWEKGHFGRLEESLLSSVPGKGEEDNRDFAWRCLWARYQESLSRATIPFDTGVYDVSYSPDGRWLAVALGQGQVVLADVTEPENPKPHVLVAPADHVLGWDTATSVAFSGSGNLLVAGGGSFSGPGSVCVWEFPVNGHSGLSGGSDQPGLSLPRRRALDHPVEYPNTGEEGVDACVTGVALNPDGTLGASLTGNGRLKVWSTVTGQVHWSEQITAKAVSFSRLSLSADGAVILAWSEDTDWGAWELRTGKRVESWKAMPARGPMAFSRNGTTLVTNDSHVLRVWKLTTNEPVATATISDLLRARAGMALSPKGDRVAICGRHGVSLFSTENGRRVGRFLHHTEVQGISFSPDGSWLATGSLDGTVKLFNLRSSLASQVELEGGLPWAGYAISRDGSTVAVQKLANRSITLWNTDTNQEVELPGSENVDSSFAISPDGKTLFTTSHPGNSQAKHSCEMWDLTTGQPKHLADCDDHVQAINPHGSMIAMEHTPFGASMLRRDAGARWACELLVGYPQNCQVATGVTFSPDGQYLFSGGGCFYRYGFGILWDTTGEALTRLEEFHGTDRIYAAAFSPDSRMLAVAYRSNKLVYYDVARRRELSSQSRTTDAPWGLSFSPDGKTLVAGVNGGIEFWRVSTRELLGILDVPTALNAYVLNANALIVVHRGCLELLRVTPADEIPEPRDQGDD